MTDAVVPIPERSHAGHTIDDRLPEPPRSVARLLKEAVLALPHLGLLLARLLRDPRVPRRRKLVAGAAAAYLALPFDVIPDFVPVAGRFDDVVVTAYAIHHLIEAAPAATQREYWEGSEDALDIVRAVVTWGAEMVPRPLRRLVER